MICVYYVYIIKRENEMQRFDLYLTELQMKKLKAISKKRGLAIADLIRRMVDDGLGKYEEKLKK
jgi:hypothetical protein